MTTHWLKPEDPVDPSWFGPLEALSAQVAGDAGLPQINPDHFFYVGWIDREGFPRLHMYRHIGSKRYLNIDEGGHLWRYTGSDKVGSERYAPTTDVRDALTSAELFRGNLLAGHLRSGAGQHQAVPAPSPPAEQGPRPAASPDRVAADAAEPVPA
jgi:hypothetical protein